MNLSPDRKKPWFLNKKNYLRQNWVNYHFCQHLYFFIPFNRFYMVLYWQKSRIRVTLNLSADANSSTDTLKKQHIFSFLPFFGAGEVAWFLHILWGRWEGFFLYTKICFCQKRRRKNGLERLLDFVFKRNTFTLAFFCQLFSLLAWISREKIHFLPLKTKTIKK